MQDLGILASIAAEFPPAPGGRQRDHGGAAAARGRYDLGGAAAAAGGVVRDDAEFARRLQRQEWESGSLRVGRHCGL